jgi:hypothetical protein
LKNCFPFLITFPPKGFDPSPHSSSTENVINNPMFLQQTPSETKHESIAACDSCIVSTTTSESSEDEGEVEGCIEEQNEQQVSEYFYMHMPMNMNMNMDMPSLEEIKGESYLLQCLTLISEFLFDC